MSKTVFEEIRDHVKMCVDMGSAPDAKVLVLRPEVYYQYSKETWLSIDGVDHVEENYLMDPNYEFILMSEEDYVRNVVNGIWQEAIEERKK